MTVADQPAEEATVESTTEGEFAQFSAARGTRVKSQDGQFWRVDHGRYQPLHFYAQLRWSEIGRPSPLCWAYRTAVVEADRDAANGAIPLHLIEDLQAFSLTSLRSSKRRQIRASLDNLQFVEITDPQLLFDQGLGVLRSAVGRHRYGRLHDEASYSKSIEPFFNPRLGLILGALREHELVGYITLYVVDGIGYVDEVHLASDALDTHVGPGLTYQAVEACKRSPEVRTLVHGLAVPERPGLVRFKEQMGFPIVEAPAFHWIAPGVKQLLRSLRPHAFYRFTGHRPGLFFSSPTETP